MSATPPMIEPAKTAVIEVQNVAYITAGFGSSM